MAAPSEAMTSISKTTESLLLTAERMAKLLDISKRTLWRLRSAGKLPRPVALGGSVRWKAEEVRRWIDGGCPPLDEWEATHNTVSR